MPKNTEYNKVKDMENQINDEAGQMNTDNVVNNDENFAENGLPMDNAGEVIGEIEVTDPAEAHKTEVAELKDKYLRLYADFENFRRRTAKEKLEMLSTASADVIKSVLPIVDDFERAKVSFDSSTEIEALKEGVDLIYTKLYKALEAKGLKPMLSKGEVFDAELHESIAQFPAPSDDLKGKVIDEIEKGYLLNEKVIRYAKVIVGA
ncbi:nucleotide exchange factor GrpE [Dyadobacter sp. CY356]|uniref:nucleotide exchange factor GrpE n=1 Tax=Dyadobacter sp. CY356 TaxID=2906442 RepID=UPI001F297677|nr:nucleotide exchange factor GrpE [Dyadobacter sp. CY356]